MKKTNKIKKILILLFLVITLTGCTKVLKDSNKKAVKNEATGQSITENILCKPTNKETLKIYEDNEVDLSKLPECKDIKIGKYDGIWSTGFVKPLAYIIVKLGNLVGSTGLALIIITFLIRLVLYPVTKKTAMQSETMKEAQPELSRIEKKYEGKTDQESQSKKGQEMMAIYKKHNINPLSGCLFALIQLPLLLAFIEAINRVPAIFEETFLGFQMGTTPWTALTKLGGYHYIILVVLILLATYFSFKMNKSIASPEMQNQNKIMMIFMIVFIGYTSFIMPAATGIYWTVSSAFTILQNLITDRSKKNGKKSI